MLSLGIDMAQSVSPEPIEQRLSIRASAQQKRLLKEAAERRRTTVSQFVLDSSLSEAERVLAAESGVIQLNEEQFAWMTALMEGSGEASDRLKLAVRERAVWDE